MHVRDTLILFRRHRIGALAAGAVLALLVLSLLAVKVRADENHGSAAHNVSLSCPGTVDEGDTVVVTLTRGSNATKPIKGTVRTEASFAQTDDYSHGSRAVNHNGNSKEVRIGTTQDTRIEGDESFRIRWINDHNDSSSASCRVLILDDDVDVESVAVTSTPESGDTYGLGETIKVTLTLDKNVDAADSASVTIELDTTDLTGSTSLFKYVRSATYESGSGTDTIVYAYTVQRYDLDTDGLSIRQRDSNLGLPGLTYAGTSTNVSIGGYSRQSNLSDHKVDGLPRITDIEITSEPDDDDAYRYGEEIVFEMTLDAAVKVVGSPGLKFELTNSQAGTGDGNVDEGTQAGQVNDTRWAVYDADLTRDANDSSEGRTVIFVHAVGPTDKATGGVGVPANATDARTQFVIPGKSANVRFEVLHNLSRWDHVKYQAHYDHDGLDADSDHAVDGTDPLIEIDFGTVNNALGATLTFWNIPNDDGDLTWRADITSDGNDQDSCEGTNMGADNTVAEDDIPDLGTSLDRTVNLAAGCTAGSYTMDVTATVDGEEVASASTSFQINLSWSPGD